MAEKTETREKRERVPSNTFIDAYFTSGGFPVSHLEDVVDNLRGAGFLLKLDADEAVDYVRRKRVALRQKGVKSIPTLPLREARQRGPKASMDYDQLAQSVADRFANAPSAEGEEADSE